MSPRPLKGRASGGISRRKKELGDSLIETARTPTVYCLHLAREGELLTAA